MFEVYSTSLLDVLLAALCPNGWIADILATETLPGKTIKASLSDGSIE